MKNYGLALMQTEDIDYTVIYYENLVKLNPKNVDHQFNLAMNLRRKKNDVEYARAYNVFNYIVEKHPNIDDEAVPVKPYLRLMPELVVAANGILCWKESVSLVGIVNSRGFCRPLLTRWLSDNPTLKFGS